MKKILFLLLLINGYVQGQELPGRYKLVLDTSKNTGNVDLSDYAKKDDLDSFAKKSDLTGLAKSSTLNNYVTTAALNSRLPNLTDYLTNTAAKTSFAPIVHTHTEYVSKVIEFTPLQTSSYTLAATDASKWVDINCPTGCNLNLPNPIIYQIGTQVTISNINNGRVQFVPAKGVRILTEKNGIALTSINAVATVVVKSADTYQILGSINP